MNANSSSPDSRRNFLKKSSTVLAASVAAPYLAFPRKGFSQNSETLKIGLIGCGGRGSGAADQAMKADGNVALTAMGDVFPDRLQNSLRALQKAGGEKCKVTPENCFIGLDAYANRVTPGIATGGTGSGAFQSGLSGPSFS